MTPSAESTLHLDQIAESLRGTYRSMEDMSQSFLREAIVQGLFPPGYRLNLDEIAESLGVSRAPIRASLLKLENEGLVRIDRGRGTSVSMLDADEISEIYELRILLESRLLALAAAAIDDDMINRLETTAHELDATPGLSKRLELRHKLYDTLYRTAGRPRMLAQVHTLRGSVGRYLLLQRIDEQHGHEQLTTQLRSRDIDSAVAWLAIHLDKVSQRLQSIVASEQELVS